MAGKKLTDAEVQVRVDACYDLRYGDRKMKHDEWQKYCHEAFGDKSELQYTQYWMKAGEKYENNWKEKLGKLLDPAVNELFRLLTSEDEKIKQRAIDQIMKYTGNDIQKLEGNIKVENVELQWGSTSED
jgi:hypothetical protein